MSESIDNRVKLYVFGFEYEEGSVIIDTRNAVNCSWSIAHRKAAVLMSDHINRGINYNGIANKLKQIFVLEWIPASIIQNPNYGGKDGLETNEVTIYNVV